MCYLMVNILDLLKRVTGLRDSLARVLAFKMALKFKSVVLTAVLICDPLFSAKRVTALYDSRAVVLAFLEFCSHEYI